MTDFRQRGRGGGTFWAPDREQPRNGPSCIGLKFDIHVDNIKNGPPPEILNKIFQLKENNY